MGTVEQNSPVKMVFTVIAATLAFSVLAQSVPVPSPQTAQDWARWTAVNPADWAQVTNVDWSRATGNIDWSRTTNVDWSNALSIPADWGKTIDLPGLGNAFSGLVGSSSSYRKKRSASPMPQAPVDWARFTAVNPADWAKVTNVDWSGATGNIDWSRTTNVDWSNALSIPADWGRTINLPGLSNAFTGLVGSSSAYRKKRSASPIPQFPTAANPANWAQFNNGINWNRATGTNGLDWSSATGNIDWSRVNNVDDWRRVLSPLVNWGRTVALPALGNALDLIIDSSSSSDNYSY